MVLFGVETPGIFLWLVLPEGVHDALIGADDVFGVLGHLGTFANHQVGAFGKLVVDVAGNGVDVFSLLESPLDGP